MILRKVKIIEVVSNDLYLTIFLTKVEIKAPHCTHVAGKVSVLV